MSALWLHAATLSHAWAPWVRYPSLLLHHVVAYRAVTR